MKMDKSFPHKYDVQLLNEIKPGYEIHYYPEASGHGGKDGVIILVNPEQGEPWIGIFAFGNITKDGLSGVYTTPHPDNICVVSNGAGYIVSSNAPTQWEYIKSIPIKDVRVVPVQNIIIFADYTELVAYDNIGFKWRTKQLASDGFKIIALSSTILKGEYYSLKNEETNFFEVNLNSGLVTGGEAFEH